jgi:hypothetical protein
VTEENTMTATTTTTTTTARRDLLRPVLRLDAAASGALGVAAAAGAGVLDTLLGLPGDLLRGVGVFLVVYAVALVVLAARPRIPRPAVWVVVLGNSAWVLAGLGLAVGLWSSLTVLGIVVVLAQAGAVTVFADLQYAALRRR